MSSTSDFRVTSRVITYAQFNELLDNVIDHVVTVLTEIDLTDNELGQIDEEVQIMLRNLFVLEN